MLTVVLPAAGLITAYIQGDEPSAPVDEFLIVGWNEDGKIVIAEPDGQLREVASFETVREIVWQ